jgi:iron complex outermembrane receptor protein
MSMQITPLQTTCQSLLNKLVLIAIFCACSMPMHFLHAQNARLPGEVRSSEDSIPLEDVNVYLKYLNIGSATDIDGQFSINKLPFDNVEIKISILGYRDTTLFIEINNTLVDIGKIFLKPEVLHFDEISVEVHSNLDPTSSLSSFSMSGKKMQENMKGSIAQTLQNEVGVAIQSMGQGTTRPILRGYSGDRFLITENGFEVGDLSQTSVDHALSMDLGGVEEIEIIRGPRALLFGSNTISGVIDVEKNSIPEIEFDHFHTYLTSGYDSGNKGLFNNISLVAPMNKNNIRISLQNRKTGDQITPLGALENTSMNTTEGFFGITRFYDRKRGSVSIEQVEMVYGIPGSPEGHIDGVDLKMNKTTQKFNYHQDINFKGFETFDLDQKFIHYGHSEFESQQKMASVKLGQDILLVQSKITGLKRELGAAFQYRMFKAGGFYWTPNTSESNISFFGFNEKFLFGLTGQVSFRGEYSIIEPQSKGTNFSNIDEKFVNNKNFGFLSLSAALIKSWDNWQLSTTIMRAGRTPGIEDLFSDGPHLGSYSYEIGNPTLNIEKTLGLESSLQYQKERFSFLLNGFFNQSPNFHQYMKMGDGYVPGSDWIEWGSGSSGWLYKYQMRGIETEISGGELQLGYKGKVIDITSDFSFVRGKDKTNNEYIGYMPADKISLLISTKSNKDISGSIRLSKILDQTRLSEFETMTQGYSLIDIFGSYSFETKNGTHRLVLQLNNLLNETYYNHLSKIKSIMPETGRSIGFQYRYLF